MHMVMSNKHQCNVVGNRHLIQIIVDWQLMKALTYLHDFFLLLPRKDLSLYIQMIETYCQFSYRIQIIMRFK